MSKPGQFGTFTITKICQYCNEQFETKAFTAKSCDSIICKNKYKSYRLHQTRMSSIVRYSGSYSCKVFFKTCIICNTLFTSRRYNGNTCSCECKKEYNRRRSLIAGREYRANLSAPYILDKLAAKSTLTSADIKQYPELIKAKRELIQIHRELLKQN